MIHDPSTNERRLRTGGQGALTVADQVASTGVVRDHRGQEGRSFAGLPRILREDGT
jgi:hypothetical protein